MSAAVAQALIDMRPREVDSWIYNNPHYLRFIACQAVNFPAFAFPSIEKPTVICGIVHAFGDGECWMVTGIGFEKTIRHVLLMQQRVCADMYRALDLHRMTIVVDKERYDARRYAEKLGFHYETDLGHAGPRAVDQSIYLWPSTREEI